MADTQDLAVEAGRRLARLVFAKRGNHSEVHLAEGELAAIVALGIEMILTGRELPETEAKAS